MYKIFVTHGSDDSWIAQQIAKYIKEIGGTTFLDVANVPKGANFKQIVLRELDSCADPALTWPTDRGGRP